MEKQNEQISIDEMKHFIGSLMLDRYIAERQLSASIQELEQQKTVLQQQLNQEVKP